MKRTQLFFLLLFVCLYNISFAQKLYDDVNPLAETHGKRLTLTSTTNPMYPADFLTFGYQDTSDHQLKINVYSEYRQWKFTDKLLLGAFATSGLEYEHSSNNAVIFQTKVSSTKFLVSGYTGASYYPMPNKFFVTGALGVGYERYSVFTEKVGLTPDPAKDTSSVLSYLWGAVGYGKINNRKVVEVSYDFDEALRKAKIIKTKLDDKTLLKLSELIYRQADGEYRDKYEDDEMKELFRDIESTLLNAGYITGSLDAPTTVSLYEILNNTSKKYVFYPKYSGYQVQGQLQYEVSNATKDKPHNHYLSVSGVYCLNLSKNTNFVFSGFFAAPLDTMATGGGPMAGLTDPFVNYLAFLPNRNNLDFFSPYPPYSGTGLYGGATVRGLATYIGVQADIYQTLTSVSGLQGSISVINKKYSTFGPYLEYKLSGQYDYNIYSRLQANAKVELLREAFDTAQYPAHVTFSMGFSYRVF